jgi:hypothetical protein
MQCPICSEETGMHFNGVPFCIFCESQQRDRLTHILLEKPGVIQTAKLDEWLYRLINGKPVSWQTVKNAAGILVYAVVVGIALFELVKW